MPGVIIAMSAIFGNISSLVMQYNSEYGLVFTFCRSLSSGFLVYFFKNIRVLFKLPTVAYEPVI